MIKNRGELSTSKIKSNSLCILEAGLDASKPENLMKKVSWNSSKQELKINSDKFKVEGRVFVVGAGKASLEMARVIESKLGKDIFKGIVLNNSLFGQDIGRISTLYATHPLPTYLNVNGTKHLLGIKEDFFINSKDLVICLISGGASSMLELPEVSMFKLRSINKKLIYSGASIHEVNLVRKLLSSVKAGGLASHFSPAKVVSLIIDDVPFGSPGDVGSGPTYIEDPGFVKQALAVMKRYNIKVALDFRESFGEIEVNNYVLGDNSVPLKAMKTKAESLGYSPMILGPILRGVPEHAAVELLHQAFVRNKKYNCFIFGGETTPVIPKFHGKGGRNQQFVLSVFELLNEFKLPWCISSINSDGDDYVKGIAGAIIDHRHDVNISPGLFLRRYNSSKFFSKVGRSLIKTGSTGVNLCDFGVLIK